MNLATLSLPAPALPQSPISLIAYHTGAFVALECSQEKTAEHVKKLKEILLMDVAAEAYAEKGQMGPKMDAGAGGGLGRLEKMKRAK